MVTAVPATRSVPTIGVFTNTAKRLDVADLSAMLRKPTVTHDDLTGALTQVISRKANDQGGGSLKSVKIQFCSTKPAVTMGDFSGAMAAMLAFPHGSEVHEG